MTRCRFRVLWAVLVGSLVAPAVSAGPTLVATLPIGPMPVGVAMSPRTHRVYVADGSGVVYLVDGGARQLLGTVAVGGRPSAVAVDPRTDKVYVGQSEATMPALSVMPGTGGKATPVLPSGRTVAALAVHPIGARLFVGDAAAAEVVMLNAADDTVLRVIPVSGPVVALAVNQSANRLYVSVSGDRAGIDVINLGSMALAHLALPGGAPPHVIVDPHNNRLYADRVQPPSLLAMAGAAASDAGTVSLPAAAMGLALDSQTGRVYASHGEVRQMTVVDGPSISLLTSAEMTDRFTAIVVDPQMNPAQIYLAGPSGTLAIMTDP